jgi:hypothetical protein
VRHDVDSEAAILAAVRELVERARATCLWFVDQHALPATRDDAIRFLRWIEQRADRDTYLRARQLRQWLSQTSNASSAASSLATGSR